MKRIIFVLVMAVAVLMPATIKAYDFKEGGIYYNINGNEVTVTRQSENMASYSGDVVIPETVLHDGVQYAVTTIGVAAFDNCTGLTGIEIPNSVVRIENHAFQRCSSLKSVVIPNSVTYVGRCAFWRTGLQTAVIGNSVQTIDEYAFQYCYNLTDVVLGSSVNMLQIKVFFDCYSLKSITCLAPVPPTMYAWYSFDGSNYSNATVYVPGSSMDAYKAHENWGQFYKYESLTKATGLTLDKSMVSLKGGEQVQLQATVVPADASASLQWTSSNSNVAIVNNKGQVTAIGAGEAIITAATLDGTNLTAQCVVRVYSTNVQSDNTLTMPAMIGAESGKTYEVPVAMKNTAGISAMQCDIVLPDGITLAEENAVEAIGERLSATHSLIVRELSNGAVRVLITSPVAEAFNGNEGDVFVMRLNVAPEAEDGVYTVALTNVVLADVNAMTYHAPDVTTNFVVETELRGDANGDGMVNVGDYVTIANYILELNPQPFFFSAADVDGNEEINVGDLVGVTNIVMGVDETVNGYPMIPAQDDAVMFSGSTTSNGSQSTVTLTMSNEVNLTALQMDIAIPTGMTLNSAHLTGRGSTSHALKVVDLDNGHARLLASSSMNDVLVGNEGALLTLVFDGQASSDATLDVDNIMAAEQDMTLHAVKPFKVNTGESGVKEINSAVRIYASAGNVMVETPVDSKVELIAPNGMMRVMDAKAGINTYPAERGICIVRVAGQVAKLRL